MNIQVFGKSKCFDTKKAQRYFKERRISFQFVDILRHGLSPREFDAVLRAAGGVDNLIDWDNKAPAVVQMKYMDDANAKADKVFEDQSLLRTPIVRNGKEATVGYCPEIWAKWE